MCGMKVIILKNNLKEAIDIAYRGISENSKLPILKNFLIKAKNNKLVFYSTNLEIGVISSVSAKIIEEGEITVLASLFSSIVSNLSSERLDLQKNNMVLEIKADQYEIEIPLSLVEDFPIIPDLENKKNFIVINSEIFIGALNQVIPAIQFSEIRPEISGLLFISDPDLITFVGTDSFRLALKKISKNLFTSNFESGFKTIIPLRTIQEIPKIFKKNEEIKCFFDETQVLFQGDTTSIISRVVSGTFPDYKTIIPENFETEIETDKSELINALKLSGTVNQIVSEIKLNVESGKKNFEILSSEKSSGKTKILLPSKIKGNSAKTLFNWRYFIDGLKSFTEDEIIIGLNGDSRPAMIHSKDISFTYIVMPVKE